MPKRAALISKSNAFAQCLFQFTGFVESSNLLKNGYKNDIQNSHKIYASGIFVAYYLCVFLWVGMHTLLHWLLKWSQLRQNSINDCKYLGRKQLEPFVGPLLILISADQLIWYNIKMHIYIYIYILPWDIKRGSCFVNQEWALFESVGKRACLFFARVWCEWGGFGK